MSPPEEGVRIRPMTAADLPRVMQIAASLPDAPNWPQSVYLTVLDPAATPHRIVLVASAAQAKDLQGFIVASLLPPQAELETIAVEADCQRQGLGRRLFDALAAELRETGVHDVTLEVRASNHAALGFYRSLGFGRTGIRRGYYTEPVDDAVLMRLRLG